MCLNMAAGAVGENELGSGDGAVLGVERHHLRPGQYLATVRADHFRTPGKVVGGVELMASTVAKHRDGWLALHTEGADPLYPVGETLGDGCGKLRVAIRVDSPHRLQTRSRPREAGVDSRAAQFRRLVDQHHGSAVVRGPRGGRKPGHATAQ